MFKNHIKTILRNLRKNRFYTLNNIVGLSLGFLTVFYIQQYLYFEYSYEDHIPDKNEIYRISFDEFRGGELTTKGAESFVGCGPLFSGNLPEIIAYTRTQNDARRKKYVLSYTYESGEEITPIIDNLYYADSSFLTFFGYQLKNGDPVTALKEPNTAVITQSLAKKYFKDEDPMGKTLSYDDEFLDHEDYVITGLIEDTPANTHLPFDILLSYSTLLGRQNSFRYDNSMYHRLSYTYVKLNPSTDLALVESKMDSIAPNYKNLKIDEKEHFTLEPLADLHYIQGRDEEPTKTVSKENLSFLEKISFLVLLIAFVNYINLSTSNLLYRTKHLGISKILGASRSSIMLQHYLECATINFFAIVLGIGILFLSWDLLNSISDSNMPIEVIVSPTALVTYLVLWLVAIVITGSLPAIIASGIDPVKAVMGNVSLSKTNYYRKGLTIVQFSLSFILIAATLIVYKQLDYIQSQDIGINIDDKIVILPPGAMPDNDFDRVSLIYERFINEVKELPAIESQAASLTLPGHDVFFRTSVFSTENPDGATLRFNGVGKEFIETFELDLIAGRNFKDVNDRDTTILISKQSVKALGFERPEDALGTFVKIPAFRLNCEIIGVVDDYRLESVKSKLEPMGFLYYEPLATKFFSFKYNTASDVPLAQIESIWNKHFPGNPLRSFMLKDYFSRYFAEEVQQKNIFGTFSLLAIILAVFGLAGLSIFTLKRRLREIGIRKVLGSTVGSVFFKIVYDFMKLAIFAILLSIPIIWYFGDLWLQAYSFRIPIDWQIFAGPALLLLAVAFAAVSIQTLKAAKINPTDVLRSE